MQLLCQALCKKPGIPHIKGFVYSRFHADGLQRFDRNSQSFLNHDTVGQIFEGASHSRFGALPVGDMQKGNFGIFGAGLEYYAALSDSEQYLYQTFDLLGLKGVEVNLGIGEGLTSNSNSLTFKMILGYGF